MRRVVVALALLLASCGPPWANHAGMGWRWPNEPRVGSSTPELHARVARSLEAWGYGRAVPSCANADVCVTVGTANHAGPRGYRCFAEVYPGSRWQTVAHEIGHCYGLPHSTRPDSIMCSSGDARLGVRCHPHAQRTVTAEDRRELANP